jgi:arylsulfatase A-like enzyme
MDFLKHEGFDFGEEQNDLYDGEIAHNDHQVGRLLERLDATGMMDRTAIVLTADHGEELGDHAGVGHFSLHEEVLRVPLIIAGPSLKRAQIDTRVEQIDLLPTILSLFDLGSEVALPGRDVFAKPLTETPVFSERVQPNAFLQRAVIAGDYKLIQVQNNPDPASYMGQFEYDELAELKVGVELYDLKADPHEKKDLSLELPNEVNRLTSLLDGHFKMADAGPPQDSGTPIEMTKERQEQLSKLGYIE